MVQNGGGLWWCGSVYYLSTTQIIGIMLQMIGDIEISDHCRGSLSKIKPEYIKTGRLRNLWLYIPRSSVPRKAHGLTCHSWHWQSLRIVRKPKIWQHVLPKDIVPSKCYLGKARQILRWWWIMGGGRGLAHRTWLEPSSSDGVSV